MTTYYVRYMSPRRQVGEQGFSTPSSRYAYLILLEAYGYTVISVWAKDPAK